MMNRKLTTPHTDEVEGKETARTTGGLLSLRNASVSQYSKTISDLKKERGGPRRRWSKEREKVKAPMGGKQKVGNDTRDVSRSQKKRNETSLVLL